MSVVGSATVVNERDERTETRDGRREEVVEIRGRGEERVEKREERGEKREERREKRTERTGGGGGI